MWTLFGLALAALTQFATFPSTNMPYVSEVVLIQDATEPSMPNITPKTIPDENEIKKNNSPTPKPEPNPTIADQNPVAFNNRSGKIIESVSPQAIERSPALDPCTPNTCPSPTPKPTRQVEPTKMPAPSETPFPTPVVTVIPLPTIINEPPRCPSIPPHLTKQGLERSEVVDPIYCLD